MKACSVLEFFIKHEKVLSVWWSLLPSTSCQKSKHFKLSWKAWLCHLHCRTLLLNEDHALPYPPNFPVGTTAIADAIADPLWLAQDVIGKVLDRPSSMAEFDGWPFIVFGIASSARVEDASALDFAAASVSDELTASATLASALLFESKSY